MSSLGARSTARVRFVHGSKAPRSSAVSAFCLGARFLAPSLAHAEGAQPTPQAPAHPASSGAGSNHGQAPNAPPMPSPLPKPDAARLRGAPIGRALPPITTDTRRDRPRYRAPLSRDSSSALLWIPRGALFPLYGVSEYLVRRPLGWLVTTAERNRWPATLVDFFTFGPENKIGIIPTGLIDFGFRPSVGLYGFWNDLFTEGNHLRLRAATWGASWLELKLADRVELSPREQLELLGSFSKRPDWVYHGLGPGASDHVTRFASQSVEGELAYHAYWWRSSELRTFVGLKQRSFEADEACCGDESLRDALARGHFTQSPPGLEQGYTVVRHGVMAAADSRPRRHLQNPREGSDFVSPPGSGLRLSVRGEHAASLVPEDSPDPGAPRHLHWVRYGATLGGFLDLTGNQRVVGLSLIADFAEPATTGGEVPFTEQIGLGGDGPLRGFLKGRLIDRSALAARFDYRWPVWVWLDGTIHYAVGDVFGPHLAGFEWALLRQSFGLGVRSNRAHDHVFEVLVAVGSSTFETGGDLESFRFVFGGTSGF
jgi:hypothetical protein